jgi:Response regulator receiver domain
MTAFNLTLETLCLLTILTTVQFWPFFKINVSHTVTTVREERLCRMTPTERSVSHKVLPVDHHDAVREMMTLTLEHKGFGVVAAASVTEALRHIATDRFDVLITDLHMPNPGRWFYGGFRDAPLPTECTHAADQRLPRRAECDGRYPYWKRTKSS